MEGPLKLGPLPEDCDANRNPLSILGIVEIQMRLGHYLDLLYFLCFEHLSASEILITVYYGQFVGAINPCAKLVQIENNTTELIVVRISKLPSNVPKLSPSIFAVVEGLRRLFLL